MDRAAGAIARQLGEVQGLGDQPLPGEGCVAVDQHGNSQAAVLVLEPALLGANAAFDDRIDRLEVARVGRQGEVDRVFVGGDVVGGEAEVILDVAVAADGLGEVVAFELVENHAVRLVEDVGQHVQPAAVRHADDDLPDSGLPPAAR